jgi:arylsulfatase A-like enzyme
MNMRNSTAISVAAWFGLMAGLGEVAGVWVQRHFLGEVTFLGDDQVWMAPLADLLLFLGAGFMLRLVTRLLPERWRWPVSMFALSAAATAAVLLVWPQLARWAVALLAIGGAVRIAQLTAAREAAVTAALRRRLAPLAMLLLLLGLVSVAARFVRERRTVAGLPPARSGAPNVILLIWDTVRSQNVGAYGYKRPTTPTFDSLTAQGVRFAHSLPAAPWTLPSISSMFTARWPHEHGADWLVPLNDRYPVLAQAFDSAGYRTGGFVANMFYCSREHGLARGFSHYADFRVTVGELFYNASIGRGVLNQAWLHDWIGVYDQAGSNSAEDVNRMFLHWLDRPSDRPFFAFLNYFDAHVPRLMPAPFDHRFGDPKRRPLHLIRYSLHHADMRGWLLFPPELMQTEIDAYDSGIAYMDRETAQLVDALRRRGMLDNTVLIVTADHGELFGEHGVAGHGTSLYRGAVEVPLLIVAPGKLPTGVVVDAPVTLKDLAQTALDLAGAPDPFGLPGASLRRYLTGSAPRDTVLIELGPQAGRQAVRFPKIGTGMASIVMDGHQYIRNGDGTEELYAFPDDSAQASDLVPMPEGQALLPRYRSALDVLRR